jgi:hypothetical protein
MQTVTTIGFDIAKSVFQVHGVDAVGQVVIRRQLKRRHVLAFFEKLPPCLVGIEACASSHHWSRELQSAYVKPYVKRQKNDMADAEAKEDAEAVEAAYLAKVGSLDDAMTAEPKASLPTQEHPLSIARASSDDDFVTPLEKPLRKRSKAHLAFVASQPCLICKGTPCDAHHLKIARPRSLGREVSDEFTVPLCRKHHQELHRHGNEANWWANMQVTPLSIAAELWATGPAHGQADQARAVPVELLSRS